MMSDKTRLEDIDVRNATFACPDHTKYCRVDELGLESVGQRLEPGAAGRIGLPDTEPALNPAD